MPDVRVCRTCGHGMTDQEREDYVDQCEPCVDAGYPDMPCEDCEQGLSSCCIPPAERTS